MCLATRALKNQNNMCAWQGGFTPLYAAAQNGHAPAVSVLLSVGANVNSADVVCPPLLCGVHRSLAAMSRVRHQSPFI